MRRAYQKGYVFQKGRKRSDAWQPEEPAFVQFWRDVPGQDQPTKEAVHLGLCRTRTIAERAAAEKLEQLGINSTQTFIEATTNVTFNEQAEIWLKECAQLSPGTFCTFARELSSWGVDRLTAQTPPFRWAMLSGGAPRGDDQSHDHRPPPSATLRPPVTRARSTHRGPDHRH
jgi:hypothetical protein